MRAMAAAGLSSAGAREWSEVSEVSESARGGIRTGGGRGPPKEEHVLEQLWEVGHARVRIKDEDASDEGGGGGSDQRYQGSDASLCRVGASSQLLPLGRPDDLLAQAERGLRLLLGAHWEGRRSR